LHFGASPEPELRLSFRLISSLNLLRNKLTIIGAQLIVSVFEKSTTLKTICGFKENQTEADVSNLDVPDAMLVAADLQRNTTLTKLIFVDHSFRKKTDTAPVVIEAAMTTGNFSNTGLGSAGAMVVAAFLPRCSMMGSIDVSHNMVGGQLPVVIEEALANNT
jgi:hypothetical protein